MSDTYKLNGRTVSREEFLGASGAAKERLQAMFDSGETPGVMTDAVFLQGHCNGNQFERRPEIGDFYASVAKAHGVDHTGKVYMSSLARYPGDPLAWVSSRGDAERVIDANGWGAEGAVSRPVKNVADKVGAKIAPDIVAEAIEDKLTAAGIDEVSGQAARDMVDSTTAELSRPKNPGVVKHHKHKDRDF